LNNLPRDKAKRVLQFPQKKEQCSVGEARRGGQGKISRLIST